MVMFSIIVPVYNVEKYLNRCVESILNQKFSSYELILVNDGSTDSSGSICDDYALSNDMISVIHKDNGGLSDTRNVGMAKAKGEYIVFIDSDDYIEPEALEKFYHQLKKSGNPDVLITLMKEVYEDSAPKYMDKNMPIDTLKNANKADVVNWMFNHSNNLWPAQRYVIKRSFVEENNLSFAVGYLHEDLDWTSKFFLHARSFAILDYYWYNHRIGRQGSITTNTKSKRTLDVIDLVSKNINDKKYNYIDAKLRNVMFQRMLRSLFASLSNYEHFDTNGKKNIIDALEHNKDIFKYTTKFKHKVFISASRIFGFRVGLAIMSLMHRV